MDSEYRTGSADSEGTGSDDFVQVSSEDAMAAEQEEVKEPELVSGSGVPEFGSDEYMYGDGEEEEEEEEEEDRAAGGSEQVEMPLPISHPSPLTESDPFFMESKEPEEMVDLPPQPSREEQPPSGVEDVPSPVVHPLPGTEEERPPPSVTDTKPKVPAIEAKGYLSFLNFLHPVVLYIIYWRDVKLSAVVLGVCLVVLLTLTLNTFIHTLVLLLLSFMVVSLTYIVTKISIDSFYNKEVKNPFSDYLNRKITLPEEKILQCTECVVERLDRYFNILVRLLLFDEIKSSLKFGVSLWLLSFVTNYFTVMSTVFLLLVLLFSVPPLYNHFQAPIDGHINKACLKLEKVYNTVVARVPFLPKLKSE